MIYLRSVNKLIMIIAITKTGTLAMAFYKPAGGSNPYVRICTWSTDNFQSYQRKGFSINNLWFSIFKYTFQQSTEELFCDELEGYFRSTKIIDWGQQLVTPSFHTRNNIYQSCSIIKFICLICIWPTYNLQSHPRTSISIN